MPILGVNFDKLSVEKKKQIKGYLDVSVNLRITNVEKEDLDFSTKDSLVLRVDFSYSLKYDPKVADLTLNGHIHYLEEKKIIEGLLNQWKKEKKLDNDVSKTLLNAVLLKSHLKALFLAQEVNLPPHIKMPIIMNKP